jgi:hypothetical protein
MEGRATLRIVLSRLMTRRLRLSTARVHQRRSWICWVVTGDISWLLFFLFRNYETLSFQ